MKKTKLALLTGLSAFLLAAASAQAQITWTGAAGDDDFFNPANWNDSIGPDPDANPATPYEGNIVIADAAASINAGAKLVIASGFSMTVTNSTVDFVLPNGIEGDLIDPLSSIINLNNSNLTAQSLANDLMVIADATSTVNLGGPGNSINGLDTAANGTRVYLQDGGKVVFLNGSNGVGSATVGQRIIRATGDTSFATDFATPPLTQFSLDGVTTPFTVSSTGPFTITAGPQPVVISYTPVWADTYDTTVGSFDINTDNATRQSGVLAPISYVANVPSTDYHHQVLGTPGSLLLAGDGFIGTYNGTNPTLNTVGRATASPNYNFKGLTGGGEIIGKRVSVDLDVFGAANTLSYASITIGGNTTLQGGSEAGQTSGLTLKFMEDTFSGLGNFIQLYDDGVFKANFFSAPAGSADWMNVRFDIDDPVDGNPWDGVGNAEIDIYIDGVLLFENYTKIGGYANNYITLEGTADFVDFNPAATHYFDNLTVFSAPGPPDLSGFRITQITSAGPNGNFAGSFFAPVPGNYRIDASLDLQAPWTGVTTLPGVGDGSVSFTITDAVLDTAFPGTDPRPKVFLRAVLLPAP